MGTQTGGTPVRDAMASLPKRAAMPRYCFQLVGEALSEVELAVEGEVRMLPCEPVRIMGNQETSCKVCIAGCPLAAEGRHLDDATP